MFFFRISGCCVLLYWLRFFLLYNFILELGLVFGKIWIFGLIMDRNMGKKSIVCISLNVMIVNNILKNDWKIKLLEKINIKRLIMVESVLLMMGLLVNLSVFWMWFFCLCDCDVR